VELWNQKQSSRSTIRVGDFQSTEQYPAIMQSCLIDGHMLIGLGDNIRMPVGGWQKAGMSQVKMGAKVAF
jgi:hypothetical protein